MIDKDTIERIKAAADIVDVVGADVALRKRGAGYVGLCPFHDDHSPSLYVSPSHQSWRCFACDEGGDAVSFVMKRHCLTYPEALQLLAERYCIHIPEANLTCEQWIVQKAREQMLLVNEATMHYYASRLRTEEGAQGLAYFRSRGYSDDTLEAFSVGYAPENSNVIGAVKERGLHMHYLMPSDYDVTFRSGQIIHVDHGIGTVVQTDGRFRDVFAGRVIFPWMDERGRVVGFAGRKLDGATKGVEMKYRNSSDSLVFHKNQHLWGLQQARDAIIKAGNACIVEGYTDVMSMHQSGVTNVVACCGTALSTDQVQLLARYARRITLIYDSDKAGISATLRAIPVVLQCGLHVSVVNLPEGEDPDSLVHSHTDLRAYIEANREEMVDYMARVLLTQTSDLAARAEAINTILAAIGLVKDTILRELHLQSLERISGIAIDILRNEITETE